MEITKVLTIVILFLVLYDGFMVKLVDSLKKPKIKTETVNTNTTPISVDKKLQIVALAVLCILFVSLMLMGIKTLTLFLFVPIVIMYIAIFALAASSVGHLAMSKGKNPLTEDENSSLILIGMFVALIGLFCSANYDAVYREELSIIECLLIVVEHSVYIFLVGALSIRPIKDCAGIVIKVVNKAKSKYIALSECIINKVSFPKRRYVFSVFLLNQRKKSGRWLRYVITVCLALAIPVDVIWYMVQYVLIILFWLPLSLVVMTIKILGKYLLRIIRWINELSNRRVAVIAFRIAIMAAMLIVVIANRYEYIKTTEATTSILEFIASVIIIPIVFEWIHVSISSIKE